MAKDTILGLNLDGTTLYLGKVRGQRLLSQLFHRIAADAPEKAVLDQITKAIDQVMGEDVIGIGFGVPSVVDVEKGIVYSVSNIPAWREVHLKEILEKLYGVPVFVNNDANTFVLGELHFGKGRGHRDVVGVILGTGLGIGLVFNGKLCFGNNCGAGEIGHYPYLDHDFEHYCSKKLIDRSSPMQELLLRSRAERGDKEACRVYEELGSHLGEVMKLILYAYDPEVVIFGGNLAGAYPLFRGAMRRAMSNFSFRHAVDRLKIEVTDNMSDSTILGAAALCLEAGVGTAAEEA